MSFPDSRITTNRGSDIDADVQFTDEDGSPFNLSGWTVTAYDVSQALTAPTSLVTVTVTDATLGNVHIRIEWDERLETGVGYQLRLRLQDAPEDQATNIIGVMYQ